MPPALRISPSPAPTATFDTPSEAPQTPTKHTNTTDTPDPAHAPGRRLRSVWAQALSWSGLMTFTRLGCSFLSIKITAVALGPQGLAQVAQFAGFLALWQSTLGQGLVTGAVRLAAQEGAATSGREGQSSSDQLAHAALYGTATRLGLGLCLVAGVAMAVAAPWLAENLLHDASLAPAFRWGGLALAAALATDLLHGTLGVASEWHLIGRSTVTATVVGLALFAPAAATWGVPGGLWGTWAAPIAAFAVALAWVGWRSRGVSLQAFWGPWQTPLAGQLLGFVPMLVINGAVPMLGLLLVRYLLTTELGLDAAGLWQAGWRLSEASLALVTSAVSLFFMAQMGQSVREPAVLRQRVWRTLAQATAVTALMSLMVGWLREPIVQHVLTPAFSPVTTWLPIQLLGDVPKMAGWILGMTLVGLMRSRAFMAVTLAHTICWVGLTALLVPVMGIRGVAWAHLASASVHLLAAGWALRDLWRDAPSRTVPVQTAQVSA
jgi:polysaccharide transporter, PST family